MTNNRRKKQNQELKRKRIIRGKIILLIFFIIFALVFVGIFRVIYLKLTKGSEYEQSAIENQINKVQDKIINANRGTILDRNNQVIAISTTVYNVALDLRNISEESQEKQTRIMEILSEELEMEYSYLMQYLETDSDGKLKEENDTHWKIIQKKISYEIGKIIESRLAEENLRGVYLEEDSQREYPHNNLASQIIGFIMGDTSWGIESYYNLEMLGTAGRIFRTYEANNYVVTSYIEPLQGNTVISTIDLTIQQFAEDIVKSTYEEISPEHTPVSASLIVMNPNTGEILAMAQYPNYDLNDPLNISLLEYEDYEEEFESLTEEEQMQIRNSIWKNFAISDTFEPGSTFKPLVVAAALEEGLITENDVFYCEGHRTIGGYTIHCHNRAGHGQVTLEEAMAQSCNLAMIDIVNKIGKELFYKYQHDFGFGEKTGIDLYGEVDASSLMYSLDNLNTVELATSSFGQGFNATAIQILTSFAAIINGGNLMQPYVVSQIVDESGNIIKENTPQIVRKVISEDISEYLRQALVSTISEIGTAKNAIIEGYSIGGKTGTAQQGNRDDGEYTLSFAAYLPAENPEYLALAIIHKPKDYYDGAVSVVPMIKELFLKIIEYKAIPPSDVSAITENSISDTNDIILKDYSNMSLQETIKDLNRLGLDYQIVGSGGDTVTKHFPAGNTKISQNSQILLYVESANENLDLQAVPDILNLNVEEAETILKQLGFEVIVEENISLQIDNENEENEERIATPFITENEELFETSDKKVYEQLPQAGVYIEKGTTIKIKVQ